jgi:signal transduction histidine kinase
MTMTHRLLAIQDAREVNESIHFSNSQRRNFWRFTKSGVGKVVSRKRARVNAVYALLVVSILFTLLTAAITCTQINGSVETPLTQSSVGFNPVWLSAFLLLTITCSLAFVTIIRKDRSNGKLLSKLRSTNRNLEDQVKIRTRELAEAMQSKDHFLGLATHDLKAPISSILGLLELVRLENHSPSKKEAEYLAHIEYSCRKMQRLINDLLEINRIDQGNFRSKSQLVDLASLMNKLKFDFSPQAEKKNITLAFILDIDGTIYTDADSLSRILDNLLSNAIKFSPKMRMVSLRVSSEPSSVKFEVSDQGPGILPEEQPRIFQKFQRLSNRPTNSETSTGLGLSIVKELTTKIGGEIGFTTEVGKGSTFIVTLPYIEQTQVTSKK